MPSISGVEKIRTVHSVLHVLTESPHLPNPMNPIGPSLQKTRGSLSQTSQRVKYMGLGSTFT
jgi:hypothetical protein